MTGAYIAGFLKTAMAFNVKNPLGLLQKARGYIAQGNAALRSRVGDEAVNKAVATGKEFMRARNVMLPMAAVPLVASAGTS